MGAAAGVLVATGIVMALNVASVRERLMKFAGARHGAFVPKIESIAVLPLENLSGDPEQDYFADGMTDELIATLAKVRSLRVTSRTSVMQYKKTNRSLPQIGRELNVDAVVEGTVMQSGGRARITAQLVHTLTDHHLWADSYEGEMKDILVLQGKVARAIVDEIQMKLQPDERARLATARPVNAEAYEAYVRGRLFYYKAYYRLTAEPLLKAIHYSQQAIQIDPVYAPAYAVLAASYYDSCQSRWGDIPDTEAAQKARATALKALELDNSLADAHVTLGAVHDGVDWDWAGAEREFKRAIELDPNLVRAHVGLAYHLAFVGRSDEAIREINRAVELDPLSWFTFFAQNEILYLTRHYDQAIKQARTWIEIYPDSDLAYGLLALQFEAKGMYSEEVAALQEWMTLVGEPPDVVAGIGRAYKFGGIKGVWRYDLERLTKKAARGVAFRYHSAELNSLLGNKDKAIESVERIYSDPASRTLMFDIKTNPRLDNLRSDPRFQDILRRMNLPPQE
jgi:TolB-like protein